MQLKIGEIFEGRYEILGQLGIGGMGSVYKAKQLDANRTIALKVLHDINLDDEENTRRFRREAKYLSRLQHKNIVTFYHFGFTNDGIPYAAMEYLRGKSLAKVLEEEQHLPAERSHHIMKQICEALEFAHSQDIIHRDLKPANILLDSQPEPDTVKIVDFGLAKLKLRSGQQSTGKLTKTGLLIGSIHYMSPEQARGLPVDARSDIYSCGCILYEMICGQKPFDADNPVAMLYKHNSETPAPFAQTEFGKDCPDRLEFICLKAMEKDPANRFQSMLQMGHSLSAPLSQAVNKDERNQSELKKEVSQARAGNPAKFKVFLLGAAILGLLFVALMAMPQMKPTKLSQSISSIVPQGFTCTGTIIYLDCVRSNVNELLLKNDHAVLRLFGKNIVKKEKLLSTLQPIYGDLRPNEQSLHFQLGKIWKFTVKSDGRTDQIESCQYIGDDTGVYSACNVVENFFVSYYAGSNIILDLFSAELRKNYEKMSEQEVVDSLVQDFGPINEKNCVETDLVGGSSLIFPVNALKLTYESDEKIVFTVDTKRIFSIPHGYVDFVLCKDGSADGDWRIAAIEKNSLAWNIKTVSAFEFSNPERTVQTTTVANRKIQKSQGIVLSADYHQGADNKSTVIDSVRLATDDLGIVKFKSNLQTTNHGDLKTGKIWKVEYSANGDSKVLETYEEIGEEHSLKDARTALERFYKYPQRELATREFQKNFPKSIAHRLFDGFSFYVVNYKKDEIVTSDYPLFFTLKLEDGEWKIDSVREMR